MNLKTFFGELLHKLKIVNIFKSLRARIFVLVFVTGLISCQVVHFAILETYEGRAVAVRTTEVQTQARILADHLITYGYLQDTSSEVVGAELDMLANLYDGRVMIIDDNLKIIKDTYGISEKKTIISEEVVKCLKQGDNGTTSVYDANNGYIEITTPITKSQIVEDENGKEKEVETVVGVILTSVSTDNISTTLDILNQNASSIELIIIIIIFMFSLFAANILLKPFDRITSAINDIKAGFTNEEISVPDYLETEAICFAEEHRKRGMDVACVRFAAGRELDDYRAYGERNQFGGIIYFRSEQERYAIDLRTKEVKELPVD